MPIFIIAMNWTEQGIRNVKDAPKRAAQAREIAKKFGVEIKQTYLTNGEFDLISIIETPSGDNIAKFCMQVGALGNVQHPHHAGMAGERISQAHFRAVISNSPGGKGWVRGSVRYDACGSRRSPLLLP
jgi:uncharacterized protein with GYD domain